MTVHPAQQLDVYGPDRCDEMSTADARAWCRRHALGRYENFSVLSALVPRDRRDDFAALYAFCRWADDLGDEIGDRKRARELLAWWRRELEGCFAGAPRHPVFLALAPTIEERALTIEPFEALIRAFEQDQEKSRYETWAEVVDYCRLSANPVGRLVLAILGEPRTDAALAASDAVCTALQLTNHWQDLRRDLEDRDRIYAPRELITIDRFEEHFRASAAQGYAVDRAFLGESRVLVRTLVDRTWPLYEEGEKLLPLIAPASRPLIWLFSAGGMRVLRLVEMWNYETVLHRPALGRATKVMLVLNARLRARFGGFSGPTALPEPGKERGG